MRNLFLCVLFIFSSYSVFSQTKEPVKWSFSAKKINASTYEVHLSATLESGWHIYSQTTPDGGPVPTSVSFTKNPLLNFDGDVKEVGKLEKHFEDLFGVDVKQFSKKVSFVQTVKVKGNVKTSLNGVVEYMTCNDRECLPPSTQKFSIILN